MLVPIRVAIVFVGITCVAGWASESDSLTRLRTEFLDPPKTHTQVPFWFWNDEITEEGILKQIEWMEDNGVHGFLPHARIGLAHETGYMSDRWLELVQFAVRQAEQRGMMVYLYDEGMYPSGSAHGKVVEGRPDLASQGLRRVALDIKGPKRITLEWPMASDERAVAAVLVREVGEGNYSTEETQILPTQSPIDIAVPDGEWRLSLFIQTPSGGVIRGVHWDEEDDQPNAPASADLLNPEVTERFINETHEKYYAVLSEHFGKTVHGIFTDEPSILGRRSKSGLKPWTGGLLEEMNRVLGYDFSPYLPFLWDETANGFERGVRGDFQYAVDEVLNKNYYEPISKWCADHGIALTGHPGGAGEISPQIYFQEPGQDVVWRWVLPGETSLEGEQSTLGKSGASVAVQLQRPIVINECYGAFGWRLTPDEMKWLADWLFVRGTNRLFPHAFYYSVRDKRIDERPPDLSWFNLWRDHYRLFSDYTNRMSWLLTDSRPIVHVAVLTTAGHTPWAAAKTLLQNQIDFHYLDETLLDRVEVRDGAICIGDAEYVVLILDGVEHVTEKTASRLFQFAEQGAHIIAHRSQLELHPLRGKRDFTIVQRMKKHLRYKLAESESLLLRAVRSALPSDITCAPASEDLRVSHLKKVGADEYLLTNEGEQPIRTLVTFSGQERTPEIWCAETGAMKPADEDALSKHGAVLPISLAPRQSQIVLFHPEFSLVSADSSALAPPRSMGSSTMAIALPNDGWRLEIDGKVYEDERLGDWTAKPENLSFSGTGRYTAQVEITAETLREGETFQLDLGDVRAWAEVEVNGESCGVRLWQPFHFDVTDALRAGKNVIRIGVTNTRANELTKEKLPSGLLGPVRIVTVP